jgi:hypothetical protein
MARRPSKDRQGHNDARQEVSRHSSPDDLKPFASIGEVMTARIIHAQEKMRHERPRKE